jgi:transcriptional regulator with XRE-family HTH domain
LPVKPAFGRRLVQVMEERQVSIAELAVRIPVHPVSISKWRGGHLPAAARLARLAGLLGVSVPWLRDGTGPMEAREDTRLIIEAQREFRDAYGASALELAPYVETGKSIPAAVAYTLLRRLFEAGNKALARPRFPEMGLEGRGNGSRRPGQEPGKQ